MALRPAFYKIHIWLSWIVGLQIILWVASGLFMAFTPIERVRGEHLVKKVEAIDLRQQAVLSPTEAIVKQTRPVERVTLKTWLGRPAYELRYADGRAGMVDAISGKSLTPLTAFAAANAARAVYAGREPSEEVTKIDPKAIPLEFRRDEPAWAVRFHGPVYSSGSDVFYVSAETGEVIAKRTTLWRVYDFMWGLHIMDWGGRENFNSPWLIAFSLVSLISVIAGAVLLFARRRWWPR
ncbi:hypothetical protein ACFOMD_08435 [Sphingoaurantiacus capsulatus]|uniref:PepSY domain-containing protein n=1 Tax=Sphingoaurantiacus capsulatus TaxID=1771310 RepID=A0ABV7X8X1_9SPHN